MAYRTNPPRTALGAILREEGRRASWLADRVGVNEGTMSRWINGLHVPEDRRAAIAEALGRTADELWPEDQVAA